MIKIELNLEQVKMLKNWIGNMSFEDTEKVCKEAKITSIDEIVDYDCVFDNILGQLQNKLKSTKNKTKKSFREVISDIEYDEIWVCKNSAFHNEVRIEKTTFGFKIYDENSKTIEWFSDVWEFELQRKEYSFEEAFKAYEDGKEIESFQYKYKKIDNIDKYCLKVNDIWEVLINQEAFFTLDEIRNKWYIND